MIDEEAEERKRKPQKLAELKELLKHDMPHAERRRVNSTDQAYWQYEISEDSAQVQMAALNNHPQRSFTVKRKRNTCARSWKDKPLQWLVYDIGHEVFNRTTIKVYSDDNLSSSEMASQRSEEEESEVIECGAKGNSIVAMEALKQETQLSPK